MSLHIPNHHRPLYFTLTMPVRWLEFSKVPPVDARKLKGRSLPIDVDIEGGGNQEILDESTYPNPSSTIIFYTDNAGTVARIFTGSPSKRKNTQRPVVTK